MDFQKDFEAIFSKLKPNLNWANIKQTGAKFPNNLRQNICQWMQYIFIRMCILWAGVNLLLDFSLNFF